MLVDTHLVMGFRPLYARRALTAHHPAHCHTYALPDSELGHIVVVLVHKISGVSALAYPSDQGTWELVEASPSPFPFNPRGRLSFFKVMVLAQLPSDRRRQFQNQVFSLNNLVLEQRTP